MTNTINISLRSGEKIFINGAVLRVDRKVSIELLNNVSFLLENHVLQAEDANSPLRQLYYIAQAMLIDPNNALNAREIFDQSHALLIETFDSAEVRNELKLIQSQVANGRVFDALKALRALYPLEAKLSTDQPTTEFLKQIEKVEMTA